MNPPLLELPHLLEIAHARASLAPRFYAIVAALGSPRAAVSYTHLTLPTNREV